VVRIAVPAPAASLGEPLSTSVVFRRLEGAQGGAYRLNRFDEVDLLLVAVPYWLHLVLEIALGGQTLRTYGTIVAMCLAVWVLRTQFPDGLLPLVRALGDRRHLSALARDSGLGAVPYPPARQVGQEAP